MLSTIEIPKDVANALAIASSIYSTQQVGSLLHSLVEVQSQLGIGNFQSAPTPGPWQGHAIDNVIGTFLQVLDLLLVARVRNKTYDVQSGCSVIFSRLLEHPLHIDLSIEERAKWAITLWAALLQVNDKDAILAAQVSLIKEWDGTAMDILRGAGQTPAVVAGPYR